MDEAPRASDINPWHSVDKLKFCIVFGCFSLVEHSIWYPFQLIKTHQQVFDPSIHREGYIHKVSDTSSHAKYIFSTYGIRGFFRGFLLSILPMIPGDILYYLVYNESKLTGQRSFEKSNTFLKNYSEVIVPMISGLFCDLAAMSLWLPCDVIGQRLMLQDIQHSQLPRDIASRRSFNWNIVKQIYVENGLRGFYKGGLVTALMYGPSSAVWWAVYERTKDKIGHLEDKFMKGDGGRFLVDWFKNKNSSTTTATPSSVRSASQIASGSIFAQVLSGAIAGGVAAFVSQPLDVVKTRYQTSDKKRVPTIVSELFEKEGARGFFRGVRPRLTAAMPASAVSMLVYETACRWSNKKEGASNSTSVLK